MIQSFMYNNTPISFNNDKGVMVNATEMAKAFGKRPSKWLELPSTQEFLSELGAIRKSDRLVSTINGVGTWFHEDVALEFARWLSPTFSIWCNDRIKELLQHGVSTVRNDDEAIAYAMNVLAERLKASQEREKQLASTNENQRIQLGIQDEEIKKAAPKVEYYDKVMQSNCTMTTTQIANGLGMPCHRLNKLLRDAGIQYKQSGQWLLRSPYTDFGLHAVRTQTYTHADGSIGTSQYTVWNERGKRFISALAANNWNVKQAIKVLSDF